MSDSKHEEFGLGYLWHLEAIGLRPTKQPQRDDDAAASDVGDEPAPVEQSSCSAPDDKIAVAIIDNGATYSHPNLAANRMPRRRDFAGLVQGAVFRGPTSGEGGQQGAGAEEDPGLEATIEAILAELEGSNGNKGEESHGALRHFAGLADIDLGALWQPTVDPRFPISFPFPGLQPKALEAPEDATYRFAAHGTCCAGLVGANPDVPQRALTDENGEPVKDDDGNPVTAGPLNPHAIKYCGVDPAADIIPINTVYSHEYWTLIAALLYAWCECADVILMPRAVEDMAPPEQCDPHHRDAAQDPRYSRFLTDQARWKQKQCFEHTLAAVSKVIPVVVAAGNSGPGRLEYPARLKVEDPGAFGQLIVVGAATAYGSVASYSAGRVDADTWFSGDVTIFAPGDDRAEVSEDFNRYDEFSWSGRRLPPAQGSATGKAAGDQDYCPYKILAIDIPGAYGYSVLPNEVGDIDEPGSVIKGNGQSEKVQNQPASLYTLFGGTSAAASIVAGTISLMKREKKDMTVTQVIEILNATKKPPPNFRNHPSVPLYGAPACFLNAKCAVKKAAEA